MILQRFSNDEHGDSKCLACLQPMSGLVGFTCECDDTAFGVKLCDKLHLHKSCANLPHELSLHPLHPKHSLTLITSRTPLPSPSQTVFVCGVCRDICFGFFYYCKVCQFSLDLKCVANDYFQQISKSNNHYGKMKTQISYCSHPDLLALINFKEGTGLVCSVCLQKLVGLGYGCTSDKCCYLSIHDSCAERQQEINEHPLHPNHPLIIDTIARPKFKWEVLDCRACGRDVHDVVCKCTKCSMRFHVACVDFFTDILKLRRHGHKLIYFPYYIPGVSLYCHVCKLPFKSCSFYRCMDCRFAIHLECIPLPKIVKHECHSHPFMLKASIKELVSEKYYICDTCEKQGNPDHHVYHCEECDYFAHIDCVISEEETSTEVVSWLEAPDPATLEPEPSFCKLSDLLEMYNDEVGYH